MTLREDLCGAKEKKRMGSAPRNKEKTGQSSVWVEDRMGLCVLQDSVPVSSLPGDPPGSHSIP